MASASDEAAAPNVVPDSPAPRVLLGVMALAALAVGWGATLVLDRVQYERLSATYEGRPQNVSCDRAARITAVLVKPGQRVVAGQPLVELSDEALDDRIALQEKKVHTLESQLTAAQAKLELDLETQRRTIQQEMFETRLKSAEYLQHRFASQLERVAWEEILRDPLPRYATPAIEEDDWMATLKGFATPPEEFRVRRLLAQGTAANAEEVAASQFEICEERLRQLNETLSTLPDRLSRSHGVATFSARLDEAKAELEALQRKKTCLTLTARQCGVIGVFHKGEGERVASDETIVQVLDDSKQFVQLRIDSGRMNDFAVDRTFDLKFSNGFAGKGRVAEIEPQAGASPDGAPLVIVRMDPAGASWPEVPFGTAVEVRRLR